MKFSALLVAASVATASAFVPSTRSASSSTQLNESIFKKISNLDLWAPVADSNDYGARGKKKIVTGKLTEKSYIPTGLTKAQYEKIRAEADKKKAANYQKNVAKAGVFDDYTEFYLKRGTEVNGSWMSLPNLGHRMAKTKYDWSGETVRCFCHPFDLVVQSTYRRPFFIVRWPYFSPDRIRMRPFPRGPASRQAPPRALLKPLLSLLPRLLVPRYQLLRRNSSASEINLSLSCP